MSRRLKLRAFSFWPHAPLVISLLHVRFQEDAMSDTERIKLLEAALIKYVELYGFIDEARDYYIRNGRSTSQNLLKN